MDQSSATTCDAILLAAQTGRLDFVSALLAIIGIMLGIAAIYSFVHFRRVAQKEANKVAQEVSKQVAERVANSYVQSEMPDIVRANLELFNSDFTDDNDDMILQEED